MEILSLIIVGGAISAAFLYTIWPIMRPETAGGVLPDAENAGPLSDRELTRLLADRDQAYRNILDIEFDKEMGKLSNEDYAQMIAPARARAMEVLRRLDAKGVKEGMAPPDSGEREAAKVASRSGEDRPPPGKGIPALSLDERLEAEILTYRKSGGAPPAGDEVAKGTAPGDGEANVGQEEARARFCVSCGNRVNESDNFCAACGHPLN